MSSVHIINETLAIKEQFDLELPTICKLGQFCRGYLLAPLRSSVGSPD